MGRSMLFSVVPALSDHGDILDDYMDAVNLQACQDPEFLLLKSGLIALRPDGGFVLLPGLVSFFLDLCDDVYRGM